MFSLTKKPLSHNQNTGFVSLTFDEFANLLRSKEWEIIVLDEEIKAVIQSKEVIGEDWAVKSCDNGGSFYLLKYHVDE